MLKDQRILQHPGLQPLWDSLDRERIQQQYVAVGGMILSLFSIMVGITSRHITWALVGGLAATACLWWLFRILSEQPLAAWRRQLREEPESIVWVYSMVVERMPFGFKTTDVGTLYLVDTEGDCHTFGLKPKDLKLVTKTLNRVLPHAEFGYTPEREMKYRGEITNFKGRDNFNNIK
ncbi:MAG: hypothetical protein AAF840_08215 [Bacteroidota bacterium]